MNLKFFTSILGATAVVAMSGCGTSQPVSPATEVLNVPPPEISIDLPLEPPDTGPAPKLCQLGSSCLAMDPRPFEPCLLSTRECRDKLPKPVPVVEPEWIDPSTITTSTR
jgi:hypothetical protein